MSDDINQTTQNDGAPTLGVVAEDGGRTPIAAIVRRGRKGRGKRKSNAQMQERQAGSLKLTVPPLSSVGLQGEEDMRVDPNEPRYCYCNQVSFGEVLYFKFLSSL